VENIFADEDSYYTKGADYHIYMEAETGRIHPLEYDGNETFLARDVNKSPMDGETLITRPLISKLLAVPELRQRYLAHVRTILAESFDWNILGPEIETYQALIGNEVRADTKKLYTTAAFDSSMNTLRTFVTNRRNYLLSHAEIKQTPPEISFVSSIMRENASSSSSGKAIRVTAKVAGSAGIKETLLYYATGMVTPFDRVLMYDDGLHGDGGSGDGIFGGDIPSQPAGNIVRYYIEARASDTAGTAAFAPAGAEHDVYVCTIAAAMADSTPVIINEVMASNNKTIQDPQNEYEDWIELLNIGDKEINLTGMYLSDNPDKPRKWAFPEGTTIAPESYLIVWADEDGADKPGLHANFKLSAGGESIFLVDTDERGNTILDTLTFESQEADISSGRFPDGTGEFTAQLSPTPGSSNAVLTGLSEEVPVSFTLSQNYPNPFNSSTVICFSLPKQTDIDLSIYNLVGQKVATLIRGMHGQGIYRLHWDGRDDAGKELASGIYLYRLQAGAYSGMHRLLLLR
jgi:hypothetical protein